MNVVSSKKRDGEPNIWNKECEELLAEWSERASCYRWLHGRCEKNYRSWYYGFSIPVIILSTLTGAANVGMDSFVPAESKSIASAIVGGVNIFAGIISTLQNFLKVAELMEGHRLAGVSWGKLQRNIAIELALDPERRVIQSDFLKISRAEYDRLIEAGPIIDDAVIKQFNNKFKSYQVSVPSICNGLDKCKIFKVENSEKKDDLTDGIKDLITKDERLLNETTNNKDIKIKIDEKDNEKDNEKDDEKDNEKDDEKDDEKDNEKDDEKDNEKDDEKDDEKDNEKVKLLPEKNESLNKNTQTLGDKKEEDLTSEFLDDINNA